MMNMTNLRNKKQNQQLVMINVSSHSCRRYYLFQPTYTFGVFHKLNPKTRHALQDEHQGKL